MKKFAAFDIDGTLIRWQLYHAIAQKLASQGILKPGAIEAITDARKKWKDREDTESFHAYEQVVIQVYENSVKNIDPKKFDSCVQEVTEQYKNQVYTYTKTLIATLKSQGYILFAISGSHHELVAVIAKRYGFTDFIGTKYRRASNAFTGEKYVPSLDKKTALQMLVKTHNASFSGSYAVGDSKSDAAMLELVENPIAFNPDQQLAKIAKQNGWPIVVERKNVVYKLAQNGSTYELL
jgi:HAD superfamily hydrolase (TIGR01490 family)